MHLECPNQVVKAYFITDMCHALIRMPLDYELPLLLMFFSSDQQHTQSMQ